MKINPQNVAFDVEKAYQNLLLLFIAPFKSRYRQKINELIVHVMLKRLTRLY